MAHRDFSAWKRNREWLHSAIGFQLGEFRLIPEISGDLQTWFDADTHPTYFLIHTVTVGNEMQYFVERGVGWPGSGGHVFLRLRIERV